MEQIEIQGEVYISTAAAIRLLEGLVSTKALRKAAREMGWQQARIKGKWWYRESDVDFPDWSMSTGQRMFMRDLSQRITDIPEDEDILGYNYYQAKGFLRHLGIDTPQVIYVDGVRVARAYRDGETRRREFIALVAEGEGHTAAMVFERPELEFVFETDTAVFWRSKEDELTTEIARRLISILRDVEGNGNRSLDVPYDKIVLSTKESPSYGQ